MATSDVRPIAAGSRGVAQFTGPIEQVPPAYSALMIDGVRAYDRARRGEAVDMPTRAVTIHAWTCRCGRGLGHPARPCVQGHLYPRLRATSRWRWARGSVTMLRRLSAGPFTLEQAISLDRLNEIGQGRRLKR
jgi:tRNA pseudouridine55 synthase